MKLKYPKLLNAIFITCLLASSCKKDSTQPKTELFYPNDKNIQLVSGFINNGVPIKAENWSVEYVKDATSGEKLLDKEGKPLVLNALGTVELLAGWLTLEKKQENNLLNLSLKENFSDSPRKFLIGILADGKRDELSFTQTRGKGYAIVKKEIIEVPGSRKEYTSKEGLHAINLSNNTSIAKNMETTDIYKDVKYMSEFSSEDYGAFNWVNSQDTLIFMDEILRNGAVYWSGQVPYQKGETLTPFVKKETNRESLLVQPYTNIKVSGEVMYIERECLYTFTIKNLSSGNTFEVSGKWKQTVPLSSITYIHGK